MNEQGFYRIEKALQQIDNSAGWCNNPVKTIREEIEILKAHIKKLDELIKEKI